MNRRQFFHTSLGAALAAPLLGAAAGPGAPAIELPSEHREAMRRRKRRIVVQYDANDVLWSYWNRHRGGDTPFDPFGEALFTYMDQPGSQVDAIWWDVGGSPFGATYPSRVLPPPDHPLVRRWLGQGVDWVERLVSLTRRRRLEVFWNHRISEVESLPEGGLTDLAEPLKLTHPDWVAPASWWPQGLWNLAAPGLREYKVAELRELAKRYDFDGIQIDFSRHIPCLPVGRQWELRGEATQFMRQVREMTLEVGRARGRPLLLAAKVPENVAGCAKDGLDVAAWGRLRLVDILTLGSRTMDVDVEGVRAAAGPEVRLQPCFDDHHATDGYRYGPIEFLRGVFANHFARGADSVVTFNWSVMEPGPAAAFGLEAGPLEHRAAYREVGEERTLAGRDKIFAVERRGGYPWAEGYFNRNDLAPLPFQMGSFRPKATLVLHIADAPLPARSTLVLQIVVYPAVESARFSIRLNGRELAIASSDTGWKDPQIHSPGPQPSSGGPARPPVDPRQRLVRLQCDAGRRWRRGPNLVEVVLSSPPPGAVDASILLEKLEGHLRYG